MRDLIQLFTVELGEGALSSSEEMIVDNAAMARMMSEDLRGRMVAGTPPVSDEDVVRIGRLVSLAVRDLNSAKAKRSGAGKPFSMAEHHLASLSEPEDDDDEIKEVEFIVSACASTEEFPFADGATPLDGLRSGLPPTSDGRSQREFDGQGRDWHVAV